MMFLEEIRAHKWIVARALLTGWCLWILSLVWFFSFVSGYLFVREVPKPYPVNRPFESPQFFARGVGLYFSPSDPIGSVQSLIWMPIAAPIGINQRGLGDYHTFIFGIVLPLIVAALCGWVVARFHRNQQRVVVLLFAGSILLISLLFFARFANIVGSRTAYALGGPLSLYVTTVVTGILLGGRWVSPKTKRGGCPDLC